VRIKLAKSYLDKMAVYELYVKLIEAPDEWEGSDQAMWLARNRNGLPCAFGTALVYEDLNVGYLTGVGARAAWRGRHIHSRMLRIRIEWAKRRGLGALVTYIVPGNYPSLKGLMKFKFHMHQVERGRWRGYHLGVLLLNDPPSVAEIVEAQRRMFL
jgi:GNAT superfamily N-acetyltransferase